MKRIHNLQLAIFSITLFISAALMFGLQPMVGKMLLPMVGGTPSGWIVAMAFFQVMLLAGYFLAHLLSRFEPRAQGLLYLLCLGGGLFFLPAVLADHAALIGPAPMAFDVFLLLSAAVAAPFIALSATASTLQRLFTTTGHAAAQDPYFLYAASNLGSFAGLLLYPFYIESRSTLTMQSQGWLWGYVLLIVLAAACLLSSGKKSLSQDAPRGALAPVGWKKRLEWLGLSFIPSGLLLAVTTHITTDIISVPLLWVLPLGVYLLTFVIAFSKKPFVSYEWVLSAQPASVAVALTIALTLMLSGSLALSWYALGIHLVTFCIVALMCHMRLARARPVEDPRHLTEFYLMLAAGGALGGVANAFIAPVVFNNLAEYPLMMLASVLFNENIRSKFSNEHAITFISGCAIVVILAVLHALGKTTADVQNLFLILAFILVAHHPKKMLLIGAAAFFFTLLYIRQQPSVLVERNFYGVIKVSDRIKAFTPQKKFNVRYMQHGTTLHGFQILDKAYETVPTTYYTREGPLGDVVALLRPKTVAAVGLGTGTVNCYATPETEVVFFEIDPAVIKMAREKFTYLSKCGNKMPDIILGDARLELKKLARRKFDLIVLDAFSSDMIPTHLLTKEAMEIYLQRLNPAGILLFHVSNRYFRLEDTLAAEGKLLGLKSAHVMQGGKSLPFYASPSIWVALARPNADLAPLSKTKWIQDPAAQKARPWTDDYTDLLGTLRFMNKE